MPKENQHYSTQFPDVKINIHTVPASLRRHLFVFKTIPGVFSFKKLDLGTKVLIDHLEIPQETSSLLDLACGYGIIGIVAAYESPLSDVYLVDINKHAIWCTKENVKLNLHERVGKILVLEGNYFEPFKEKSIKFDAIYINPPLRKGRKEFLKLLENAPNYLKPNGFMQFVIKKKMGADYIFKYIINSFSEDVIEITCKRSGYWVFKYSPQ